MGDLEDALAEATALREALATAKTEADSRYDAVKKQQADAKAKAKAIILRQRAEANQKVEVLEKEKERQAEELKIVKDMLREEAEGKKRFRGRVEELEVLVERGKNDLERLVGEKGAVEEKVRVIEDELRIREAEVKAVKESGSEQREGLEKLVAELEEELRCEREQIEKGGGEERVVNGEIKAQQERSDVDGKMEEASEKIAQLEITCERLEKENETLLKKAQSEMATPPDDGTPKHMPIEDAQGPLLLENLREAEELMRVKRDECNELKSELSRLRNVITALEAEVHAAKASPAPAAGTDALPEDLDKAREELKSAQKTHQKAMDELVSQKQKIEEHLARAEESVVKFRSDLESSELALQEEREKVLRERQRASEATANDDDSKKILEAKVSELERVIASKQADIVKVRDKARTYLKDINAEKREMEEKMKHEVEALRKDLVEEQEKVQQTEQRAESSSSELDNCLALIREKQKSLQMLKMTISTEKKAAEEARRERDSLRAEFAGYKERARFALQEKQSVADASGAAVEAATASLRSEVEKVRKDNIQLRKQIASLKQCGSKMQEVLDRAEKAEAAVDLLRKDAKGASAANYSQIDILEEKIAALESEVAIVQASAEDAEARHDTTMMRLEAAERALRGAEVRAEEAARLSNKTIEGLKKQVETLESALERAEQSSAAAQRTAAAAAKALAFTSPQEKEETTGADRNVDRSPHGRDSISSDMSSYNSQAALNTGRASFAAAMEGHSGSLGLGVQSDSLLLDGNGKANDADLLARDKQITVLTTQVVELGALLDDAQQEANLKSEQTALLKAEVKNLDAKLAAAEKLQNGAPFSYLRTIVVRYLETDDPTLLPVVANVLSFTKEEEARVMASKGSISSASTLSANSQKAGYFSLPFLGSR